MISKAKRENYQNNYFQKYMKLNYARKIFRFNFKLFRLIHYGNNREYIKEYMIHYTIKYITFYYSLFF